MTSTGNPFDQARQEFGDWLTRQAEGRWPGARVRYRGRARHGSHRWEILAPGIGEFWLAADEPVLTDPNIVRDSIDVLESEAAIERLPDTPTRAMIVKEGGRLLLWDPEEDDTVGLAS
jgi:hypothetical protein